MLQMVLIMALLAVSIAVAWWGHSRWGYIGWSPAAVILVAFVALWSMGIVGW
jgi:hypothetical protein